MLAHSETGGQPGPVDGGAHQGAAHGLAFRVEVVGLAFARGVAVVAPLLAAQNETGKADIAGPCDIAVLIVVQLEQGFEAVALVNVALEVHVEGINADQFHQGAVRHPGVQARFVEAGGNGATAVFGGHGQLARLRQRDELAVLLPVDEDIGLRIGAQGEAHELLRLRFSGERYLDLLTGAKPARREDLF